MAKRWNYFGLIMMLALILVVVGCSENPSGDGDNAPPSGEEQTNQQTPGSGSSTNSSADDSGSSTNSSADESIFPLKEKVVIDIFNQAHSTKPTNGTEPVFVELEKRTNVELNLIKVNKSSYDDQFQLSLASGDRPETMETYPTDAKKYGMEGAFMPLDDLLKEHGPNIMQMIEDHGIELEARAADGHIYGIPLMIYNNQPASILVRQDWLDELQMDAPETAEEFYQMLKAFKDNQLGGPDTVPLAGSGVNMFNYLFMAFGTYDRMYLDNGEFLYGPAQPEMKEALEYVNRLYEEDLVDSEFATLSAQQFEAKVSSGTVGSVMASPGRADMYTQVMSESNPEAKMVGIAPLKDPSGNRAVEMYSPLKMMLAISSETPPEKAEIIVKFYNYLNSEEGRLLMQYGIENETYVMKDGQADYTESFNENLGENLRKFFGLTGKFSFTNPLPWLYEDRNAGTLAAEAVKTASPYYVPPTPVPNFTAEESDIISSIQTEVTDTTQQYLIKFILGQEPLSNFDKFLEELEKKGVEQLVEIYNTAYQRDMSNK